MRRENVCRRATKRSLLGLCAGVVTLALASPAAAVDPGEVGLSFLKIGVGARAAGMGEAYVAVAQDPTSLYWNPSGIASAPGNEVHASHNEWISDVRYEWLAAVHGMRGHAVGVHVGLLHMGDIEGRDASGNFTENFQAYDFTAGVTYAYRILRSLEIGATGKVLYERIQDERATGLAVDLGARYRTPVRGLVLAATATNLGTPMTFVDDEFVLPFQVRGGAAYRTRAVLAGLILAADVRIPNDSDAKTHLGVELWPHEMVALRGGVKSGYDEEAGAFGVGIKYREYQFDYAYAPFSDTSELGDMHRVSFGWRPGSARHGGGMNDH